MTLRNLQAQNENVARLTVSFGSPLFANMLSLFLGDAARHFFSKLCWNLVVAIVMQLHQYWGNIASVLWVKWIGTAGFTLPDKGTFSMKIKPVFSHHIQTFFTVMEKWSVFSSKCPIHGQILCKYILASDKVGFWR